MPSIHPLNDEQLTFLLQERAAQDHNRGYFVEQPGATIQQSSLTRPWSEINDILLKITKEQGIDFTLEDGQKPFTVEDLWPEDGYTFSAGPIPNPEEFDDFNPFENASTHFTNDTPVSNAKFSTKAVQVLAFNHPQENWNLPDTHQDVTETSVNVNGNVRSPPSAGVVASSNGLLQGTFYEVAPSTSIPPLGADSYSIFVPVASQLDTASTSAPAPSWNPNGNLPIVPKTTSKQQQTMAPYAASSYNITGSPWMPTADTHAPMNTQTSVNGTASHLTVPTNSNAITLRLPATSPSPATHNVLLNQSSTASAPSLASPSGSRLSLPTPGGSALGLSTNYRFASMTPTTVSSASNPGSSAVLSSSRLQPPMMTSYPASLSEPFVKPSPTVPTTPLGSEYSPLLPTGNSVLGSLAPSPSINEDWAWTRKPNGYQPMRISKPTQARLDANQVNATQPAQQQFSPISTSISTARQTLPVYRAPRLISPVNFTPVGHMTSPALSTAVLPARHPHQSAVRSNNPLGANGHQKEVASPRTPDQDSNSTARLLEKWEHDLALGKMSQSDIAVIFQRMEEGYKGILERGLLNKGVPLAASAVEGNGASSGLGSPARTKTGRGFREKEVSAQGPRKKARSGVTIDDGRMAGMASSSVRVPSPPMMRQVNRTSGQVASTQTTRSDQLLAEQMREKGRSELSQQQVGQPNHHLFPKSFNQTNGGGYPADASSSSSGAISQKRKRSETEEREGEEDGYEFQWSIEEEYPKYTGDPVTSFPGYIAAGPFNKESAQDQYFKLIVRRCLWTPTCTYTFNKDNKRDMWNHIQTAHKPVADQQNKVLCMWKGCTKGAVNKNAMHSHLQASGHTGDHNVQQLFMACNACGRRWDGSTIGWRDLKAHTVRECSGNPYFWVCQRKGKGKEAE